MATGIEVAPEDRAVLIPRRALVLHDQTRDAPGPGEPPIAHDVRAIDPDGAEARLSAGFTTYGTFGLADQRDRRAGDPDRHPPRHLRAHPA